MKKFLALAALVLGLASCQTEPEGFEVVTGGEVDTYVTVNIPQTETRSSADSALGIFNGNGECTEGTMRYIFQVYYKGETKPENRQVKYSTGTSVSFPVRLVPNRDYQFVVWADVVDAAEMESNYYNTDDLKNITLIDNSWNAMDEKRDAFTATYEAKNFNGSQSINIELYRPFAKLRVVTTDYDELAKFDITATKYEAEYTSEHYARFNAYTGKAEDKTVEKSHGIELIKAYTNETDAARTIFSDYFFANEGDVVQFNLKVYDQNDALIKENNFNTDILVQPNYLTTLKGEVLTTGNIINVITKPGFGEAQNPNHKNYTVITSGAEFVDVVNNGRAGNYVIGNDITIENNDTRAMTRAAAAPTTVIDLNGMTITAEAGATVVVANTLVLTGEGTLVGDADFIDNTNGKIIVAEEAEVNGVNEAVKDETEIANTASWLADVLARGGEYVFTKDEEFSEILVLKGNTIIDGNGYTLTSTATRAINVSGAENVTIKNLNIVASGERAINVIQNSKNVTIENVTAKATNYTFNVASSAAGVTATINNCDLTGLNTVNIGGQNTKLTINNTKLTTVDNNEDENYSTIVVNKDAAGSKVVVNGGEVVIIGGFADGCKVAKVASDGSEITFNNTKNASNEDVVIENFAVVYGDYYYGFTKFEDAVKQAAKDNAEVLVVRTLNLSEPFVIAEGETVVLDLNGKTITTNLKQEGRHHYAIDNYGTLTLEGEGAINARGIENFGTLTVNGNVVITNIDTNGGAAIWNEGKATINGGTFKTNAEAGEGSYGAALNTRVGGEAIVNGGTFIANSQLTYAIINDGTTVINYADVKGKHGAVATSNGSTSIYNGIFEQVNNNSSDHCIFASGSGVVTVYGGKYKIEDLEQKNGGVVFKEYEGGTITIADGYKSVEAAGGWYYVVANTVENVAYAPIENKAATRYEGDHFETGYMNNALWLNNYYFDGDAAIKIDNEPYSVIVIENCSGNFKNDVITINYDQSQPSMILENLNFTIAEGKKLINSATKIYQVFMGNITINGELMTQETIGQYLENVEWYQVVDPEYLH